MNDLKCDPLPGAAIAVRKLRVAQALVSRVSFPSALCVGTKLATFPALPPACRCCCLAAFFAAFCASRSFLKLRLGISLIALAAMPLTGREKSHCQRRWWVEHGTAVEGRSKACSTY